jgi:plastocyanin
MHLSSRATPAVALWSALLLTSSVAAQTGTVSGTITAKGLRTSAWIVVSLEAPGLNVVAPQQPVEMDQKQMEFMPHVLPVVTGTTVRFLNSDSVTHNVFSPEGKYNLGTWPTGESREYKFEKPGVYTQLCQVHPEMEGYVIVLSTPYFATTDKTGHFEIQGVAAGKYTLVAWSEKLKSAKQEVTVEDGKATSVDLTITR